MEQKQYLLNLYPKLINRTISDKELSWLLQYFETNNLNDIYIMIRAELAISDEELLQQPSEEEVAREVRLYNYLENEIAKAALPIRKISLWPRIAIAVAVATVIFGAGFFYYSQKSNIARDNQASLKDDVAPGKPGATLTLANGKKIKLTDAADGELTREAGVVITKSANGQLVYEIKNSSVEANQINTLSTSKGETYQVHLPDGSLVWLNASSSLTYFPHLNERGKRRVRLEGEAYFEIAKDRLHPFVVQTRGQEVEVLGTEFNVNAYSDESLTKTTLAEGSIRLTAFGKDVVLKPNQEAISGNGTVSIKEVNSELASAWKSDFFLFDSENLESIMSQISRWYDVDIVFTDPSLKNKTFTGTVSRYENISQVFKMLEKSEVARFKIEGRKITVEKMK